MRMRRSRTRAQRRRRKFPRARPDG
jgi:hypothetical protein